MLCHTKQRSTLTGIPFTPTVNTHCSLSTILGASGKYRLHKVEIIENYFNLYNNLISAFQKLLALLFISFQRVGKVSRKPLYALATSSAWYNTWRDNRVTFFVRCNSCTFRVTAISLGRSKHQAQCLKSRRVAVANHSSKYRASLSNHGLFWRVFASTVQVTF